MMASTSTSATNKVADIRYPYQYGPRLPIGRAVHRLRKCRKKKIDAFIF
jgi:hypothetical protein